MSGRVRMLAGTLGVAVVVALAGCSSSTSKALPPSPSTTVAGTSSPTLGSTRTDFHYFSQSETNDVFGPDGKVITDPNAAPQVGDYFVSTGTDFLGDHSTHGATAAGSDHLACVVKAVSGQAGTADCFAQIDLDGSMLYADNQTVQLTQAPVIKLTFTGGTGAFKDAQGTITATNVGNTNDTDFLISAGNKGGASSVLAAASTPALKAAQATLHYFSQSEANDLFGADGTAITDANAAPQVGDYFVSTGTDFTGDHATHASVASGTDHLACVVTAFSGQSVTAQCFATLALGNSLLYADHATVQISQNGPINLTFTGGTGDLQGVHGTIVAQPQSNSNDSDFDVTISK